VALVTLPSLMPHPPKNNQPAGLVAFDATSKKTINLWHGWFGFPFPMAVVMLPSLMLHLKENNQPVPFVASFDATSKQIAALMAVFL